MMHRITHTSATGIELQKVDKLQSARAIRDIRKAG